MIIFEKMIIWLVFKLEISYRVVIISWRILGFLLEDFLKIVFLTKIEPRIWIWSPDVLNIDSSWQLVNLWSTPHFSLFLFFQKYQFWFHTEIELGTWFQVWFFFLENKNKFLILVLIPKIRVVLLLFISS
jgi:hypothetical protein